jgi:hypothetical protein
MGIVPFVSIFFFFGLLARSYYLKYSATSLLDTRFFLDSYIFKDILRLFPNSER